MTTRELAEQLMNDLKSGKLKKIGGKDVEDAVDREWPRNRSRERLIMETLQFLVAMA